MGQLSVDLSAKIELLKTQDPQKAKTGISFPRYFTTKLEASKTPYDEILWETRTASIGNDKGSVIFEQRDVEVPVDWSQTATNIVASKYFHGKLGSPDRETSVAQLVQRVVDSIADWGQKDGYFKTAQDGENFRMELAHLMLTQKACFNSPVWFNVGVKETRGYGWIYDEQQGRVTKLEGGGVMRPQCSACFIVSVKDSLESILDLAKTEGMLFKWGSGTGSNLSALREEDAILSGGGHGSGLLSWMKGFAACAGVSKSGGKTRRAAKMVILNVDHPDIDKFIWCKAKEENKAYTLVDAGYDASLDGEAYSSIFFQNANNSVRATDDFMEAVGRGDDWWTKGVATGQPVKRHKAQDLMRQIAEATHQCGDPGMQFDTTVNRWHPCKNTARINASNPCSEYMFLDDSACNLSSLNLMKFVGPDGQFDVASFRHAVDTTILALIKYKKLVGGGVIKIVNNTAPAALIKLGYSPLQVEKIVTHIDSTGTIEGAPELKPEHLPVFDCSFRPQHGTRSIHYMGHVKMMAAVQPFISGAISKTINMPEECTVEDIMTAYTESWKLGLKAVAIYRDNSKRVQPLSSGSGKGEKKNAGAVATAAAAAVAPVAERVVYRPVRRKLPDERRSITHKFSIGGHEGYITVGMYDDGAPGEIFITMAKEGSTISGLMD